MILYLLIFIQAGPMIGTATKDYLMVKLPSFRVKTKCLPEFTCGSLCCCLVFQSDLPVPSCHP